MKMIDNFTNLYSVTKTLRFRLIPIGKTEENFVDKKLLEEDEQRAADYKKVKGFIDRYHKKFIEDTLNQVNIIDGILDDYAELYFKTDKSDDEKDEMRRLETDMRVQIVSRFKANPDYQYLFKKEMITQLLPDKLLTDEEELYITSSFNRFTTYFSGFHENRRNMYSEEEKSTAISYRIVNENLPRFLDNARAFIKIRAALGEDTFKMVNNEMLVNSEFLVEDYFTIGYFNYVLSETGIEDYNNLLGGYSSEFGEKIQGLNELINLYNQKLGKNEKSAKLPKLKPLYKQILSDKDSFSYIPEQYNTDDEVLESIVSFYVSETDEDSILTTLQKLSDLFNSLSAYTTDGIYYDSRNISSLSAGILGAGAWGMVREKWNNDYDSNQSEKSRRSKKYEENRDSAFKKIQSFNIAYISKLVGKDVLSFISSEIAEDIEAIYNAYGLMSSKISIPYNKNKKLSSNTEDVQLIKTFLDSLKKLENDLRPLRGTGKEEDKDELFYGDFLPLFDRISGIDLLYNKVRNYVTKKPYSNDKIKLNFQNPQLLNGWDNNKISDYRSVIMRKNDDYYLAIMDKSSSKALSDVSASAVSRDNYELMNYKLLPGPNKMLPKVFLLRVILMFSIHLNTLSQLMRKEHIKKG